VISSEEAIAKGTRRIVALTGPEAEHAFQRANRVEERVNGLSERVKQNPDVVRDQNKFKDLTKEINDMNAEFNAMLLPYWRKDLLRNTIKEAQKTLDSFDRKVKNEISDKVLQQAKDLSQSSKDDKFSVYIFEKGANAKVNFLLLLASLQIMPICSGFGRCVEAVQESESRYGLFDQRRFSKVHCFGES
jgi:alanyl-tRNA synthetase